MKNTIMALCIVILTGCSALSPQKPIHIESQAISSNGDLYAVPANVRTIDIRKKTSDYIICSEPVPDIAMSNALKLALEASSSQISGSVSNSLGLKGGSEASTTALELAGRTQIVLLAREFIYSNCNARANGWISNADFNTSQSKIVAQISEMIKTDTTRAETEKATAVAVGSAIKAQLLDEKALLNVSQAFEQAKAKTCLDTYDTCIVKAAGDANKTNVCRTKLAKCNN